jgi:hypothetical protein
LDEGFLDQLITNTLDGLPMRLDSCLVILLALFLGYLALARFLPFGSESTAL